MTPDYTPDHWVVLKITSEDHPPHYRILCSWRGGYHGTDHWKLSSGNLSIEEYPDHYLVPQHSGTVYKLFKDRKGWSSFMWTTFVVLKQRGVNMEEVDLLPLNHTQGF
jgi:hypothetical protein